MSSPFDPGLQVERTLLAWRRTCLALGVGAALVVRFGASTLGGLAVAIGLVGVLLALGAYVATAQRYRQVDARLRAGGALPGSAAAVTLVSCAMALLAITCGLWLLLRH